ncbi:MAG: sugar phosphate isomerase/epimerase [Planctomycetaceae bacterium]|jgi:sugar phosphate isomerase/epimerase|nr:sugar phosphate isomerase/epimerase [Planctomycetaceae bacterium]
MKRRNFLKTVSLGTGTFLLGNHIFATNSKTNSDTGLILAVQTWTFRLFDLDVGIRKIHEAGVRFAEIAGGIQLSGQKKRASAMTVEERKRIKEVLAENNVQAVSLGGCQGTTEEFDFAADMGLLRLQGEPPFDKLVEISERAEKYKIQFTLHNHAKPNKYWNYKETLQRLDGCSSWLGFCPDTGHMIRSGIDPLVAIKELKGRIFAIHLKDLNDIATTDSPPKNLHDVSWGTGKGQVEAILHELLAQKKNITVIIEYEYDWENNLHAVTECVAFFQKIVSPTNKIDLLKSPERT